MPVAAPAELRPALDGAQALHIALDAQIPRAQAQICEIHGDSSFWIHKAKRKAQITTTKGTSHLNKL